MFQVLGSRTWLVAKTLDSEDMEHSYHHRKLYWIVQLVECKFSFTNEKITHFQVYM